MASDDADEGDEARIDAIRSRWEAFDNTGDASLVLDVLADDVALLPPGRPPVVGRDAVAGTLREFPSNAYDVDHRGEALFVSDDLAVDYVTVEGVRHDEDGDEAVSHKAVDVYRRRDADQWELVLSIWNDQG